MAEKTHKDSLMRESYNKRLNLLIHGLAETEGTVLEARDQIQLIYNDFMIKGLQLDPVSIPLVKIHRLPQQPVVRGGVNIARPIIIKLNNAMDKHKIMSNLSNLKAYNLARQNEQQTAATPPRFPKSVYITEHLPKEFQEQRKRLLPRFKEAKKPGQKTKWAITNGFYCLYVDDKLAN